MAELTEEQQKFLDECEKEFSLRYTDDDREFMRVRILLKLYNRF